MEKNNAEFENPTLVAHSVHVVMRHFENKYKKRLNQCVHGLVTLCLVETKKSEGIRGTDIGSLEDQNMFIPPPRYCMQESRY